MVSRTNSTGGVHEGLSGSRPACGNMRVAFKSNAAAFFGRRVVVAGAGYSLRIAVTEAQKIGESFGKSGQHGVSHTDISHKFPHWLQTWL